MITMREFVGVRDVDLARATPPNRLPWQLQANFSILSTTGASWLVLLSLSLIGAIDFL